jgi:adenine nucleotide transporter 17
MAVEHGAAVRPIHPIAHAIGGALGSAASMLVCYPLERARIELQSLAAACPTTELKNSTTTSVSTSCSPTTPAASSLVDCLRQLWRRGELYRGLAPNVLTLTVSSFVYFYVHTFLRQSLIGGRPSKGMLLSVSCLAGVINVLLTNPLWVGNLRLVTENQRCSSDSIGLWKRMRDIANHEGISALWQGTGTSILLVSNPVIQFFAYEQLKAAIVRQRYRANAHVATSLAPLDALFAGAVSKSLATVCTYPLQLTQTVLRLQKKLRDGDADTDRQELYVSTWACLAQLYARGGVRNLFTGMRAKLLQTALTAALTFLSYEQILMAVHQTHLSFHKGRLLRQKRSKCRE